MYITVESNCKISSTTIDSITKDTVGFANNPHFIWTDKELDPEQMTDGREAFYNIKTDEIYYQVYTEPEVALSETDEAILNTNLNVEYLIALQELGL
ncbi:MAG: hypothetical protein IJA32_06540 [Lachnospiraceae bacterium]|nr:hypothetical protein [Lachnospiraceae bacterium]